MSSSGAWIIVEPGTAAERLVPIDGRLLVGRECAGAPPSSCLVVSDPAVSRDHLEIRASAGTQPTIVDLSTNGTRVNGRRIERGQQMRLSDGDRIELGSLALTFRAAADDKPINTVLESTIHETGATVLAIAVGNIVRSGVALAGATKTLFAALGELAVTHHATVSNFAGEATFAAWDAVRDPDAAAHAVEFALAADELVAAQAIREAEGEPLQMGWAVTLGETGVGHPPPGLEALHGDAVTLAFRVAGVAARGGHAPVLVSARAAAAAQKAASYGQLEEMHPEGYSSVTWVRPATRV